MRHRDKIWRAILGAGVLLIILMCLFPPYSYVYTYTLGRLGEPTHSTRYAGYCFITSPPDLSNTELLGTMFDVRPNSLPFAHFSTEIDIKRMVIQGVAVLVLTVGLVIIFYQRRVPVNRTP